jgi:hypothetical protein
MRKVVGPGRIPRYLIYELVELEEENGNDDYNYKIKWNNNNNNKEGDDKTIKKKPITKRSMKKMKKKEKRTQVRV